MIHNGIHPRGLVLLAQALNHQVLGIVLGRVQCVFQKDGALGHTKCLEAPLSLFVSTI